MTKYARSILTALSVLLLLSMTVAPAAFAARPNQDNGNKGQDPNLLLLWQQQHPNGNQNNAHPLNLNRNNGRQFNQNNAHPLNFNQNNAHPLNLNQNNTHPFNFNPNGKPGGQNSNNLNQFRLLNQNNGKPGGQNNNNLNQFRLLNQNNGKPGGQNNNNLNQFRLLNQNNGKPGGQNNNNLNQFRLLNQNNGKLGGQNNNLNRLQLLNQNNGNPGGQNNNLNRLQLLNQNNGNPGGPQNKLTLADRLKLLNQNSATGDPQNASTLANRLRLQRQNNTSNASNLTQQQLQLLANDLKNHNLSDPALQSLNLTQSQLHLLQSKISVTQNVTKKQLLQEIVDLLTQIANNHPVVIVNNNESNESDENDDDNDENNNNNPTIVYPNVAYGYIPYPNYYSYVPAYAYIPGSYGLPSYSIIPGTNSAYVDGFGPVVVESVTLSTGEVVTIPAPPYAQNMPWGTFGTYANWVYQFQLQNGRTPTPDDEVNFWISQALAGVLNISPTAGYIVPSVAPAPVPGY